MLPLYYKVLVLTVVFGVSASEVCPFYPLACKPPCYSFKIYEFCYACFCPSWRKPAIGLITTTQAPPRSIENDVIGEDEESTTPDISSNIIDSMEEDLPLNRPQRHFQQSPRKTAPQSKPVASPSKNNDNASAMDPTGCPKVTCPYTCHLFYGGDGCVTCIC